MIAALVLLLTATPVLSSTYNNKKNGKMKEVRWYLWSGYVDDEPVNCPNGCSFLWKIMMNFDERSFGTMELYTWQSVASYCEATNSTSPPLLAATDAEVTLSSDYILSTTQPADFTDEAKAVFADFGLTMFYFPASQYDVNNDTFVWSPLVNYWLTDFDHNLIKDTTTEKILEQGSTYNRIEEPDCINWVLS